MFYFSRLLRRKSGQVIKAHGCIHVSLSVSEPGLQYLYIWIQSVQKNIFGVRAEMSEVRHFKWDIAVERASRVLHSGCPVQ